MTLFNLSKLRRAVAWITVGYVLSQIMRFGGNLVLARLLSPEMFGVMAIVYSITTGLILITDVGLVHNVIQSSRSKDPRFLGTVWLVQVIRTFIVYLFLLVVVGTLHFLNAGQSVDSSNVYASPILPTILSVMGLSHLIGSFVTPFVLVKQKEMDLGAISLIEFISQLLSVVAMMMYAYINPSIWALVVGSFVSTSSKLLILDYFFRSQNISFCCDISAIREIISFSKLIAFSLGVNLSSSCSFSSAFR